MITEHSTTLNQRIDPFRLVTHHGNMRFAMFTAVPDDFSGLS